MPERDDYRISQSLETTWRRNQAELLLVLLGDFVHKLSGTPHKNGGSLKLESDMGLLS